MTLREKLYNIAEEANKEKRKHHPEVVSKQLTAILEEAASKGEYSFNFTFNSIAEDGLQITVDDFLSFAKENDLDHAPTFKNNTRGIMLSYPSPQK